VISTVEANVAFALNGIAPKVKPAADQLSARSNRGAVARRTVAEVLVI